MLNPAPPKTRRRKGGRTPIRKLIFAGLLAGLFVALLWAAYSSAERHFLAETAERGRTVLALQSENLRGWLDRFRALPRIYAQSNALKKLLLNPDDAPLLDRVNRRLELWNAASGAADTYLLNRSGTTVAASNWAAPITFVGENYAFRPYYTQAMEGRLGRLFALGTASGKRGYYFSYPLVESGRIVGVIVVKAGVAGIEAELAATPYRIFITGPAGVVLLSTNPAWRLHALAPLSESEQARIREIRQFDLSSLLPLPFDAVGEAASDGRPLTIKEGAAAGDYLQLLAGMPSEGWTLHLLVPTASARSQALTSVLLVGLGLIAIGLLVALLWQRRRRLMERLRAREEAQVTLERTVSARTADLRDANEQLEEEVRERKTAEEDLRRAQSDLIQAGKLAALGQMSAALSHEFNQPLAAIRTYTDNAAAFLERDQEERAKANLVQISKLTDRMAELSRHLRSFARRPDQEVKPVSLSAVVKEALALLAGQLQKAEVTPRLEIAEGPIWVRGGHVRLQQVVVNLITNALDAMADQERPDLMIAVREERQGVFVIVEDNGEGLSDEVLEQVFDPFFTTKEVGKGLGLGLSISFNIVKDFGGSLRAGQRPGGGARFVVSLLKAEAPAETAAE